MWNPGGAPKIIDLVFAVLTPSYGAAAALTDHRQTRQAAERVAVAALGGPGDLDRRDFAGEGGEDARRLRAARGAGRRIDGCRRSRHGRSSSARMTVIVGPLPSAAGPCWRRQETSAPFRPRRSARRRARPQSPSRRVSLHRRSRSAPPPRTRRGRGTGRRVAFRTRRESAPGNRSPRRSR